jgi:hypothetical protein
MSVETFWSYNGPELGTYELTLWDSMTLWDSSEKLKIELANTTRQHWQPERRCLKRKIKIRKHAKILIFG